MLNIIKSEKKTFCFPLHSVGCTALCVIGSVVATVAAAIVGVILLLFSVVLLL